MSVVTAEGTETKTLPAQVSFVLGLALVVGLAFAARWIKYGVYQQTLFGAIPGKALEYPLWAALIGLAANMILKGVKVYPLLKPGFRTELFLKTGLVLLGAGISFSTMLSAARGAIVQALIMVTLVYFFSWWLSGKFGLPRTLRAVMSTAVSICGVSAAIASAGAVLAKKEEVTYVTALVIVTALPLMVIAPLIAALLHLPDAVAGAWFGGNVDTTAAVVGAGVLYSPAAAQIATIVKSAQNTLIGVAAFLLALYFAVSVNGGQERPSAGMIWQRFPKFVLGFIAASLIFTFGWLKAGSPAAAAIASMKDWAFALAFVSMGLELSFKDFKEMGWKPVAVYLTVTVFNTLLALLVAWLIFGWLMPPAL